MRDSLIVSVLIETSFCYPLESNSTHLHVANWGRSMVCERVRESERESWRTVCVCALQICRCNIVLLLIDSFLFTYFDFLHFFFVRVFVFDFVVFYLLLPRIGCSSSNNNIIHICRSSRSRTQWTLRTIQRELNQTTTTIFVNGLETDNNAYDNDIVEDIDDDDDDDDYSDNDDVYYTCARNMRTKYHSFIIILLGAL